MKQIQIITRKDLMPIIRKLREQDKKIKELENKTEIPNCPYCGSGSRNVIRRGLRKGKYKLKQRYECHNCNKKFDEQDFFTRMRNSSADILKALELRKEGKTFSQIAELLGNKMTRQSVCKWMQKYQPGTEEATATRKTNNQYGEYEREFKIKI